MSQDADFLVATVGGGDRQVVEGWTDTPDHHFVAVIVRTRLASDVAVWTETRVQPGGGTMFRLEPGQASTTIESRSGPLIGWSTTVGDRMVKVLHPDRLPAADVGLAMVPLQPLASTWPPPATKPREH
ncbi:MAG: hypothetical protein AAGA37_05765 [Actinomycetota bacterium]